MSKAKELDGDAIIRHMFKRVEEDSFAKLQHAKMRIRELEEELKALKAEPAPELKGWIEVNVLDVTEEYRSQCINIAHIVEFGTTPRGPTFIGLIESGVYIVKESLDEIKQLIKGAS